MKEKPDSARNVTPLFPDQRKASDSKISHLFQTADEAADAPSHAEKKVDGLNQFIHAICDWTWEADNQGRLTSVSENAEPLCGVNEDFFRGKSLYELSDHRDQTVDWHRFHEALNNRTGFRDLEFPLQLPERVLYLRCSGFPIRDAGGRVTGYRGSAMDISDLHKYRTAVDLANKRFVQAIDSFSGSFALFDENDRIVAFNETYRKLHWFLGEELKPGLAFERCIRIQLEKGIIKPEQGKEEEWISDRVQRFHNPSGPFEVEKANNQWLRITEQRFADGSCLKTMEDISETKKVEQALRASEQRFRDFAEAAADWFFEFSPACKLAYLSKSFDHLTGRSADNFIGKTHEQACRYLQPDQFKDEFYTAIEQRRDCRDLEFFIEMPDGEYRYFSLSGKPSYDEAGKYVGFRGIVRNVSETRKLTDQLNRQARIDDLTGLPNRREFNRVLEEVCFDCSKNFSTAVVAFMDLDEFKIVNDSEGHLAGDKLLQEIADALVSRLHSGDVIARLGGDEFGLILRDCSVEEGVQRTELLLDALRRHSFRINDRLYNVSASVGMVKVDNESPDIEELVRQIDVACYQAKDMGRNHIRIFQRSARPNEGPHHNQINASDIEQALAGDRFILYAQPIAAASDHAVFHHEILVRMLDVDGKIIPPMAFIPVAERYRLMIDIDRWVIKNTFRAIRHRTSAQSTGMFTINLSGRTLTDASLVDYICSQFDHYGVDPGDICFEITETTLVSNFDHAAGLVTQLRELGCRFALDDFGSGLSSFCYLKNFQVDYLKIDGSLVKDIEASENDRKMVAAIAHLALTMGMQSVAEFVENHAIAALLQDIGVDYLQGYGIGKPAPLSELVSEAPIQAAVNTGLH